MDLSFSAEDRAFREEVRQFIRQSVTDETRDKIRHGIHLGKEVEKQWQRALFAKGWGAPAWPKHYGGTGWTVTQRYIFDEEVVGNAPTQSGFGLTMVGPVIYSFGNEEQKAHYLPRILKAEDWWCQGYSEPGSGSDLASLKTRAESDGDDYIVNGHKIWTSWAHEASMIFCLVRTDPQAKQQEGISFLLIDMTTPGITVKPIISIAEAHSLNEVFFDNVRVPKKNRIGEENKGWTYAKFLLGNERTGIARVAESKKRLAKLKEIANEEQANGLPLIDDPTFKEKLAQVEIELMALDYTNLRILAEVAAGRNPGAQASMLKLRGSEITQKLTELSIEALGYYAAPFKTRLDRMNEPMLGPDYAAGLMDAFLYGRAATIYGGSSEVQHNVLAKAVLGL